MGNRTNQLAFSSSVYTAPTAYPITVADVRDFLRVTDTSEDGLLQGFIAVATAELENNTRRKFITQTIEEKYDDWPIAEDYSMVLHWSPVASVTSITYVDTAEATQTWAATNYTLDNTSEPARIRPVDNATLPLLDDRNNAVTVRYIAGTAAASVSQIAKTWIMLRCLPLYCRRQPDTDEQRGLSALEAQLYYGL